jgi:RimJ/RimL family protein N-acetyltransferase
LPADLSHWTPRPRPERRVLTGRYVTLEPLNPDAHAEGLFAAAQVPDADDKFRWLFEEPPTDRPAFGAWVDKVAASTDPMFWAIRDHASGTIAGRQTLMRIDPAHGVIEIGNIYWGPAIARQRGATEALFLFMAHVFDDLGYRRFEWKCNDLNAPSKAAARRFGFTFEGVFRQHMVAKGQNRDTAWFSILDGEWPGLKAGYQAWLDPGNFDASGQQKRALRECLGG